MDNIEWLVFDDEARNNIDKDYVYHVRTKEGAELSGMYPNGNGFHCQNPGEPNRTDMSDVSHYAVQMTFEDHADKYVFGRE
ncbi:hypothetical protein HOU09_gp002 [Dickeya phage vB_DsoM_AD1]|uniref:Uncharacterized protein n=1 Tax=Dickeya phage vB_DsoM_AD1 TaxID=2283029 RepID=A0A384ZXU5_9CAUD|nr:hypothetical protein HOU09_gp002 [Dickeya phage vB_DsoM_AD1]AXG67046.1 hypothetical protein AD1_002 [Dickeya phage vB_DsoM_AD1]